MFGYVSLRRNIKSKDSWKTILSGDFLFADYNIDSSWSVGRRRNSTLLEESLFKLQPREQTWHIITKGQAIRVPCTLPYQPHRHSHNPVSEKKTLLWGLGPSYSDSTRSAWQRAAVSCKNGGLEIKAGFNVHEWTRVASIHWVILQVVVDKCNTLMPSLGEQILKLFLLWIMMMMLMNCWSFFC